MSTPAEKSDDERRPADKPKRLDREALALLEEQLTLAAAAPGGRRLVRLEELLLLRAMHSHSA